MSSEGVGREAIIRDCATNVNGGVSDSCSVMDPSGICVGMYLYKALGSRRRQLVDHHSERERRLPQQVRRCCVPQTRASVRTKPVKGEA
jgi:hypothetical protein